MIMSEYREERKKFARDDDGDDGVGEVVSVVVFAACWCGAGLMALGGDACQVG
jgi:hypothetical protein